METIRIQRIQISNLFGELSYDINLPAENPIAIIIAPNGRGKTTILNLTSFLFDPSLAVYKVIRSIPFDVFRCVLSNGKTVELRKIELDNPDKSTRSTRSIISREQVNNRIRTIFDSGDFVFTIYGGKKPISSMKYSDTFREALDLDPSEYLDEEDEDFYPYRSSRSSIPIRFMYIWKQQKKALSECGCDIPVNFIKADRIQPINLAPSRMRDMDEPRQVSPLEEASKQIGKLITDATDKYYDEVSQAKDRFPKMFLENEGGDLELEEFLDGWYDYRQELNQFQEIGLITQTEDFLKGKDIPRIYPEKEIFLSTYLRAFKDTTKPLKDLYARLSLFKSILDERNSITGKIISFGREGVKLAVGDREIKLDMLSSGEKHDFIMFYHLILGGVSNGLILIDEPEISLHIEWQETYLDKLIRICEMNGLQSIIATHSPHIISSHYDFLVDKGESNGSSGI